MEQLFIACMGILLQAFTILMIVLQCKGICKPKPKPDDKKKPNKTIATTKQPPKKTLPNVQEPAKQQDDKLDDTQATQPISPVKKDDGAPKEAPTQTDAPKPADKKTSDEPKPDKKVAPLKQETKKSEVKPVAAKQDKSKQEDSKQNKSKQDESKHESEKEDAEDEGGSSDSDQEGNADDEEDHQQSKASEVKNVLSDMKPASKNGDPNIGVKLEPKEWHATKAGGKTTVKLINDSKQRIAVKVKCSDNNSYNFKPVYAFIDPGTNLKYEVERKPTDEVVPGKLVFVIAKADESSNAKEFFKKGPTVLDNLQFPVIMK